jgi:GR25 family glycosyltransferase involved in LPS biosynthesis
MLDADDHLVIEPDFDIAAFKKGMSHDVYDIELRDSSIRYRRQQICSNRRDFKYRGVLHEYLEGLPGMSVGGANGFYITSTREGARSQDKDKYRKDAAVFEKALLTEKDEFLRSRYTFYLAQSYRDCGEPESALANYLKRAELGFWKEEVFESLYQAAKLKETLKRPAEEVIAAYLRANDAVPTRAEALHGASRFCRIEGRNEEGYRYAKRGLEIQLPTGGLFVENWIYDYGLLDELAVHTYWIGRYEESLAACERLLREGKIPDHDRDRIEKNAQFARDKVSTPAIPSIAPQTATPVFIHSSPRASSTWFWLKFRQLPSTLCYYEPFTYTIESLTTEGVLAMKNDAWGLRQFLRHPEADPYFREYAPLLRQPSGVQHFETPMTMQWFIPQGGLRGELRPSEKEYLSLLIRHAAEAGKVPVLGDCWSLGRLWAIKQNFGGLNIFLYRNLWQHWLSYLSFSRRGDLTFHVTIVDTIFRDDDRFFQYLVERGLKRAAEPWSGTNPLPTMRSWTRSYPTAPRDPEKARALDLLPEQHTFALFMGLHIYLYLHAHLCADLTADVSRMARDQRYRLDIEQAIKHKTGLAISLADATEAQAPKALEFDTASIDWDEIREHARAAVEMLSKFGDSEQLTVRAAEFIDAAFDEMRRYESQQPVHKDGRDKTFVTLYSAARQMQAAGRPFEEVIAAYEDASNAAPHRAEALHAASSLCREHGKNAQGHEYARRGLEIPLPADGLYLEPWVYDYGLLDELSVNAYWAGQYCDSFDASLRLLSEGKMPSDMRDRVTKNTQFSAEKVRQQIAGLRQTGKGGALEKKHAELMQIHVVNLDRSIGRFAKFKERNAHLLEIHRVSAVDGATVNKQQLVNDGTIADDVAYSPGALGCALSHVKLWKQAVDQNRILSILEDDAVCSFHFADETARLLATLPADWDLIKWGSLFYPKFSWVDFGFSKATLHFYDSNYGDDLEAFQRTRFRFSAIRLAHSFGTMGYSLSPKGARKLLDYCLPLRKRTITFPGAGVVVDDLHIDIAMCGAFVSMEAFTCIPPLVFHDERQPSAREETDNR